MPKREHIPDDADLVIKDAEGKVCAKYCRHCNIYTKGYTTAHFTREHKGSNNLCPYVAPPESGTAAPPPTTSVSINMAAIASQHGVDLSNVPVVSQDALPGFQGSSYDFDSMPTVELNLAWALDGDSDNDEDDSEIGFFQSLVKGFGG